MCYGTQILLHLLGGAIGLGLGLGLVAAERRWRRYRLYRDIEPVRKPEPNPKYQGESLL